MKFLCIHLIHLSIYDVVKSKRRHWLAVTLSFTPCGDRFIYLSMYLSNLSIQSMSGLKVIDQLVAYATRFLVVRLKILCAVISNN